MTKVDSVIALGPSLGFYPMTPENNPKFMLSFLNENILQHTIRYLEPHSTKIFIFCIEEYKNMVARLIKGFTSEIEIVPTDGYDGMGFVLNMVRTRIKSNAFILCKADMYCTEPLGRMIASFEASGDDVHGSFYKAENSETVMLIGEDGQLYRYNAEKIPRFIKARMLLTSEFRLKNFYIIKTELIDKISVGAFGFKRNIIHLLLKKKKRFRIFQDRNFLIFDIKAFSSQLDLKNTLLEDRPDTMFGHGFKSAEAVVVADSIVGDECTVDRNCRIAKCILMNNIVVEAGCTLEGCIVGQNNVIPEGSRLVNCQIANDYVFESAATAENEKFSYE